MGKNIELSVGKQARVAGVYPKRQRFGQEGRQGRISWLAGPHKRRQGRISGWPGRIIAISLAERDHSS